MPQPPLDPSSNARQRLAYARECGILFSTQAETALRDRWSKECFEREMAIVHAINSPHSERGSIRINLRSTPFQISVIGQEICRWVVQEHGGSVTQIDEDIIEAQRLPAPGAGILLATCLKRPDILWPAPEVRGW
jgi:hypothetical protein